MNRRILEPRKSFTLRLDAEILAIIKKGAADNGVSQATFVEEILRSKLKVPFPTKTKLRESRRKRGKNPRRSRAAKKRGQTNL